ncbi:hypothetical protein BAE44_0020003 [Dichanthelium oligosanthes]|uniref:DUF6598 domain-containing protein n=1 Tax=Dichanthelium oligosanthes TaxID=888268 RepID=A0A1E5V1F8_9POAL|nr:hypothetical protein BAE44_0020003 [Dichanthelium oligosanthes]
MEPEAAKRAPSPSYCLPTTAKSEEEAAWEAILGTPLHNWMNAEFTESNRAILEYLMESDANCKRYNDDCYQKTEEVNATLDDQDKFDHVDVWPRSPTPSCFYFWYKGYQMSDTSPTPLRSKRFTEPCAYEYLSTSVLQFFSVRFGGNFLRGESMSVYGFLAIRDDIDYLRNYVFCRSQEDAHVIRPDSPYLPLISPVRGISSSAPVIVEYSIKVENNGKDSNDEEGEIIDGCFRYLPWNPYHNHKVKPRIYGPLGPVDMQFMYISYGVEATINVKVKWAAKGYNLKAVTAFTSGQRNPILLYDRPASSLVTSNDGSSAWVAVASSVVAVESGGELKLAFDVSVDDNPAREQHRHEHNRDVKQAVQTHEFSFTAQKCRSTKGAILMRGKLDLVAKITWSVVDD